MPRNRDSCPPNPGKLNYRRAHRSSDPRRLLRKPLAVREALVQSRSKIISLCRSLLRQEGVRVPSGGTPTFAKRVRDLGLEAWLLAANEPLLEMHSELCDKIRSADKYVASHLKQDARAKQLESVPSIGPRDCGNVYGGHR